VTIFRRRLAMKANAAVMYEVNKPLAAHMMGAGKIIAVDLLAQELAWAEEFGATHCVDASREDPVARVQASCCLRARSNGA
jgi:Zn-dependent alcohol dehydrogenase